MAWGKGSEFYTDLFKLMAKLLWTSVGLGFHSWKLAILWSLVFSIQNAYFFLSKLRHKIIIQAVIVIGPNLAKHLSMYLKFSIYITLSEFRSMMTVRFYLVSWMLLHCRQISQLNVFMWLWQLQIPGSTAVIQPVQPYCHHLKNQWKQGNSGVSYDISQY